MQLSRRGQFQPFRPRQVGSATLGVHRAPQTQAEMAKLLGEPFAPYNKETQQYLDEFTTTITERRDAAAAAVKDFVAKAMASVGGNKPARKENVA
jgi:hypothetical protein